MRRTSGPECPRTSGVAPTVNRLSTNGILFVERFCVRWALQGPLGPSAHPAPRTQYPASMVLRSPSQVYLSYISVISQVFTLRISQYISVYLSI